MTPEQAIKTALEPIAEISGKVYPLEGMKNAAAPFVFYLRRTEEEDEALDGLTGLQSGAFEVHCVAQNYAQLISLAGSVRSRLQGMQGVTYDGLLIERATIRQTSPDLKEREVNLYRRMYVLQLNYQGG